MECSRFLAEDAPCRRPGKLRWGIPLCPDCSMFVWMNGQKAGRQMLAEAVERAGGDIYWDYGITYYLMFPNGNVKIGHVGDPNRLFDRWEKLSHDFSGRVMPLATEYGGRLKEAYRHAQLEQWRVWAAGEQFSPTPEVLRAAAIGHVPMGLLAIKRFNEWVPRAATIEQWNSKRATR